ncbi:hypothetical protein MNAN1_000869 [Malassezia nana]|uniref:Uncharacterized protein n=1 Tax=Malassezia nana TaxID=180528 RepID=A0AAF0EJJ3_9BASI|nr:hypothetical protein MNAN1_000869 [Malassezia nana]
MPDKQLPALPAGRLSGAPTYDGGIDSRLPERPWSSVDTYGYASAMSSHRPGYSDSVATHVPSSNYLGSSIVLAPLASFTSVSSLSDIASPLGESTMPLSSTPTQSLSLPRGHGSGGGGGSGVPTLSVALPSPYLLGPSSQLAEPAPAPAPAPAAAPSEPIGPPISEAWAAGLVQPCLLIEVRTMFSR